MSMYQKYHPDLVDCQPTIKIQRINKLIKVMMSRTPNKALKLNSNEQAVKKEFLLI